MANVNVFFERYRKQIGFVLLVSLLIWGGVRLYDKMHPKPEMAFWVTSDNLKLRTAEENALAANGGRALHLHLMDIVWDDDKQFAFPALQLTIEKPLPEDLSVVPVIGIDNEVFEQLDAEKAGVLADMIADRIIDRFTENSGLRNPLKSILLDCDWTTSSKGSYFAFVDALTGSFQCPVEVTLRLHQMKYSEQMGVPPVKRVMLLFDKLCGKDGNSCVDPLGEADSAADYLSSSADYPLPTDIGISIGTNAMLKGPSGSSTFIPEVDRERLSDTLLYEKLSPSEYRVLEDGFLNNVPIAKGDLLVIQKIQMPELKNALKVLGKKLRKEKRTVCFLPFNLAMSTAWSAGQLTELMDILR